jgi:DNA-binding transcriptional LysR family regulator
MESWDEIRTAYQVARLGTVSAAAGVLGVHHSTVIRQIDALEARVGVKLFQRHARGYTPTEAGQELLAVAAVADDQFSQLAGRIRGRGAAVSGDLVVTTVTDMTPQLIPAIVDFQRDHPEVTVTLEADERTYRLDYGEAHVAVRPGAAPQEPDNVVQPLTELEVALYASRDYAAARGPLDPADGFAGHRFVQTVGRGARAPFNRWMAAHVPAARVAFRAAGNRDAVDAVAAGAGVGFVGTFEAARRADLVQMLPPRADWLVPIWLVTHVDLHRTAKVQAFLTALKAAARHWRGS